MHALLMKKWFMIFLIALLGSIDDSVQWLHNFERLQQLQNQVVWPSILELEPRTYIPDVNFSLFCQKNLVFKICLVTAILWKSISSSTKKACTRRSFGFCGERPCDWNVYIFIQRHVSSDKNKKICTKIKTRKSFIFFKQRI